MIVSRLARIQGRNGSRPWRIRSAQTLFVLSVCAGVAGCVGSHHQREVATDAGASGAYHVVQPGETLWRIARTYEIDLAELAAANGIDDPTELAAGARLFVPGAAETLVVPAATNAHGPIPFEFSWPVRNGRVLSFFGAPRRRHRHAGIDIGAEHGKPVRAARAGRVAYAGATLRNYGKTIIIDHGDDLSSLYAHNSALLVEAGEWVECGESIARIGRTGNASTEHVHFEIRHGDVPIDPLPYLKRDGEDR